MKNSKKAMNRMMELIRKEVDKDIQKVFYAQKQGSDKVKYPAWYLLQSPSMTVIELQKLRNFKKIWKKELNN